MTKIRTNHGKFTGLSVASIIRREYGSKAYPYYSADPNSPHLGLIVADMPNTGSGWSANVLAELRSVEK